jgi:hypothetical protein
MRAVIVAGKGALLGLFSGFLLGFLFKWIQYSELADVYTLLLNVDFIPQLPQPLPEWFEFSMHLAVSIVIGIVFVILNDWKYAPWRWGLLMGIAPIPLFIPLTTLSERTPAITDIAALSWWVIGHLVYGVALTALSFFLDRKKS